jgi:pilus assembly protein FimV
MHPRFLTVMFSARQLAFGLVALAFASAVTSASALGLAGSSGAAVMGQPLDVIVQARLDNGEILTADCVGAEVSFGEQRVAQSAVRTTLESAGSGAGSANAMRIRVKTTVPVDEPVVDVMVSAGCAVRVSRRYMILAANSGVAAASTSQTVIVRPVAIPQSGAPAADMPVTPTLAPAGVAAVPKVAVLAAPPARATAPTAPRVAATNPLRAETSRLRMDITDKPGDGAPASPEDASTFIEQAMRAVAEATSVARSIAEAASAANQRAAVLEGTVQQLKAQAQEQMAVNDRLRLSLAQASGASRWTLPLAITSALLLGLCVWLGRRVMALQSQADRRGGGGGPPTLVSSVRASRFPLDADPPGAGALAATEATPAPTRASSEANGRTSVPAWPLPAPAAAPGFSAPETWLPTLDTVVQPKQGAPRFKPAEGLESAVERTDPSLQSLQVARLALRDVSIEELIDLEQQADFFVALDQDEAAISLLTDHLQQSHGASPLPYLKLLEIYRRRGDRADYEHTRQRFNQRFNAYAPEWDVGLQSGRGLDDYPEVMPRLMQAWARPLDSMAELEALLFRKSRGELFDLPAYREVLFLYSIARDLLEREATDTGTVDVLLPITAAAASPSGLLAAEHFSPTATAPLMELGAPTERDAFGPDDAPTAPVDFDLSVDHGRKASIFDSLKASPTSARQG